MTEQESNRKAASPVEDRPSTEASPPVAERFQGIAFSPRSTIGAVIEVLLPDYPHLSTNAWQQVQSDVTRYVTAQIDLMPGFLRLPYKLALLGFGLLPVILYGHRFRSLPVADRLSYLAFWSDAKLAPMRDFIKLIRSSALLVYFDHPVVAAELEAERRQQRRAVA